VDKVALEDVVPEVRTKVALVDAARVVPTAIEDRKNGHNGPLAPNLNDSNSVPIYSKTARLHLLMQSRFSFQPSNQSVTSDENLKKRQVRFALHNVWYRLHRVGVMFYPFWMIFA
jgi:hypothetical protein